MPRIETFEGPEWDKTVQRRESRIKRLEQVMFIMLPIAVVALVWVYVQLLGCQMNVSLTICRWSLGGPMMVLWFLVLLYSFLLFDLWIFGAESSIKRKLMTQEEPTDEAFQPLLDAYRSRDEKEFAKQLFRHKMREGAKIWKVKQHSHTARRGYQQLTSACQQYVRIMSAIIAVIFGCLAGTYLFFYTDVPALTALIAAALVAIATWYVPQYILKEEISVRNS